jgi:hypothetical protein
MPLPTTVVGCETSSAMAAAGIAQVELPGFPIAAPPPEPPLVALPPLLVAPPPLEVPALELELPPLEVPAFELELEPLALEPPFDVDCPALPAEAEFWLFEPPLLEPQPPRSTPNKTNFEATTIGVRMRAPSRLSRFTCACTRA